MDTCDPASDNAEGLGEGIELVDEDDAEESSPVDEKMPDIKSEPIAPVVDVATLLRAYKFRDCYVKVESLQEAYRKELERLNQERQKYERQRRLADKQASKRSKVDVNADNGRDSKRKKKKSKDASRKRASSPSDRVKESTSPAPAKKRKAFPALTACIICDQPINFVHSGLPVGAIYCSKDCIGKQVKIAAQCLKSDEHVMLMDMHGMILNESRTPTVEALEVFLLQYPNFRPVLNTNRLEKPHKKDLEEQTNKKVESKRVDVRKAIEYQLQQRCKTSQVAHSSRRLKNISAEIEEELFRIHKSLNLKYRTWCKGFVNRIKDENNGFFRRVVLEKVSVKKLVTMSPEEMFVRNGATDGNNERGGNAATSSTANQPAGYEEHEELILEDSPPPSVSSSNNATTPGDPDNTKLPTIRYSSLMNKYTMVKKKPLIKVEGKSAVDDILGNERDTTGQHNSHLYDANCAICQKKTKLDFAAKERAERMEAKFENKKRIDIQKRFDNVEETTRRVPRFPNLNNMTAERRLNGGADTAAVFPSSSSFGGDRLDRGREFVRLPLRPSSRSRNQGHSDDDNGYGADDGCGFEDDLEVIGMSGIGGGSGIDGASRKNSRHDQESRENRQRRDEPRWKPNEDRGWRDSGRISKESHDSRRRAPLIGDGDPMSKSSNSSWVRQGCSVDVGPQRITSWNAAERSMQRDENPWNKHSHRIWGGTFQWGRKFQFACTLTALSNRVAFRLGSELPLITRIIGKIEPANVWSYIRTLRQSWTKQVIVLMVDPPTTLESRESYLGCYELMRREKRYGFIDCENHATIKDGYVFALEPGEPLPKDLYPLEGPGLPEGAEQYGNIIVVIVRKVDGNDNRASASSTDESWRKSDSIRQPNSMDRAAVSPVRSLGRTRTRDGQDPIPATTMEPDRRSMSPDNFARYLEATQEFEAASLMYNEMPEKQNTPFVDSSLSADRHNLSDELRQSPLPSLPDDEKTMLASIHTLSDVLAAIDRLNKPAQVVLMVGHYINTHPVSEEESEIISRAISMKSEAERLRNSRKSASGDGELTGIGEGNGTVQPKSPLIGGSEKFDTTTDIDDDGTGKSLAERKPDDEEEKTKKSPVLAGPQHFDIVKLRRPPREIAAEMQQQKSLAASKAAAAASTAGQPSAPSRPDSGSSADNDSTKAQQISFSADSTSSTLPAAPSTSNVSSTPPPLPPSLSVSATTPPPPPPTSPPPPPPPPPCESPKKMTTMPTPLPPPITPHYMYMFPPPPIVQPPVPMVRPPLPTPGVNGGHPPAIVTPSRRDDMEISDTDSSGADNNNTFTSLLPPPPPPPSLQQKPNSPKSTSESFADDIVVSSFTPLRSSPPRKLSTDFPPKSLTGANTEPLGRPAPVLPQGPLVSVPQGAPGRGGARGGGRGGEIASRGGGRGGGNVRGGMNNARRGGRGGGNSTTIQLSEILLSAVQRQQQQSSQALFNRAKLNNMMPSPSCSSSFSGANCIPFGQPQQRSPIQQRQRFPPPVMRGGGGRGGGPRLGGGVALDEILRNAIQHQQQQQSQQLFQGNFRGRGAPRPPWRQ